MIGDISGGAAVAKGAIGLLSGGASAGESGFDWQGWAQKEISAATNRAMQASRAPIRGPSAGKHRFMRQGWGD